MRGHSSLIPALSFSDPAMPEEVFLHLNIDHLSYVFLVKLHVSPVLVRVVDELLLGRRVLVCLDSEGIRLARLSEDAL